VELENFLYAVLVLQHLLHARLIQRIVAGREEGNIIQVTDGGHNLVPKIANGLVKLVHRSILLFLHGEKRLLSIGYALLAAPRFYEEPCREKKDETQMGKAREKETETKEEGETSKDDIEITEKGRWCPISARSH